MSLPTIKEWLSILQASYIIFFLEPHFQKFNKRLVKTPKLYFFDTGLACSLLRIDSAQVLSNSYFRGAIFESLVISDFYKQYCNLGLRPSCYFWRDVGGAHEVDCILDCGDKLYPVEIKSGTNVAGDSFKNLDYWNELADASPVNSYLIYAGEEVQTRKQGKVVGWGKASGLVEGVKG